MMNRLTKNFPQRCLKLHKTYVQYINCCYKLVLLRVKIGLKTFLPQSEFVL